MLQLSQISTAGGEEPQAKATANANMLMSGQKPKDGRGVRAIVDEPLIADELITPVESSHVTQDGRIPGCMITHPHCSCA